MDCAKSPVGLRQNACAPVRKSMGTRASRKSKVMPETMAAEVAIGRPSGLGDLLHWVRRSHTVFTLELASQPLDPKTRSGYRCKRRAYPLIDVGGPRRNAALAGSR